MKKRGRIKSPQVIVTVSQTTWQVLTDIAAAPREFVIALSSSSPELLRALSSRDARKLFKTVTPSEIAQMALRTFLQQSTGSTPPATLGEDLARAIIHDYPDAWGKALQHDAAAMAKSRPFEKRTKRLLIKLTPAENQQFRALATRMKLGPSDLGGLLIERFAHKFPEHLQRNPDVTGSKLTKSDRICQGPSHIIQLDALKKGGVRIKTNLFLTCFHTKKRGRGVNGYGVRGKLVASTPGTSTPRLRVPFWLLLSASQRLSGSTDCPIRKFPETFPGSESNSFRPNNLQHRNFHSGIPVQPSTAFETYDSQLNRNVRWLPPSPSGGGIEGGGQTSSARYERASFDTPPHEN